VNLPSAKNAVGAFHPPAAVLADPGALSTLPAREVRSGLGEVLKYAALRPALLGRLARAGGALPDAALVAECARAKVDVVRADPTERGARKLLNLGHTFGHGVEAAGGFARFTHGEAVAVGLAFAFRLAARMGRIGPLAVAEVEDAIRLAGLPARVPPRVARRAAALMGYDKKRAADGLRWVLPRARSWYAPSRAAPSSAWSGGRGWRRSSRSRTASGGRPSRPSSGPRWPSCAGAARAARSWWPSAAAR
jgi:3-dehydroquinate synthetase